jgi:hypothetical protein
MPPEIHSCWVTLRGPSGHDHGAVTEAFWTLTDGVVTMCSESGTPTGQTERVGAQGSDRAIASRLRRASWSSEGGASDFNRPLSYGRSGYA